jgi:hypothetical protein
LATGIVVLGFFQGQDDVNGVDERFHLSWGKNRQECLCHG